MVKKTMALLMTVILSLGMLVVPASALNEVFSIPKSVTWDLSEPLETYYNTTNEVPDGQVAYFRELDIDYGHNWSRTDGDLRGCAGSTIADGAVAGASGGVYAVVDDPNHGSYIKIHSAWREDNKTNDDKVNYTGAKFSQGDGDLFWAYEWPFGELVNEMKIYIPSKVGEADNSFSTLGIVTGHATSGYIPYVITSDLKIKIKDGYVNDPDTDAPVQLSYDKWYTIQLRYAMKRRWIDGDKPAINVGGKNTRAIEYHYDRLIIADDTTNKVVCDIGGDKWLGHGAYTEDVYGMTATGISDTWTSNHTSYPWNAEQNCFVSSAGTPYKPISLEYGWGLVIFQKEAEHDGMVYAKDFKIYRPAVSTTLGKNIFDYVQVDAETDVIRENIQAGHPWRRRHVSELAGQTVSVDMADMYVLDSASTTRKVTYALALYDDEGALISLNAHQGVVTPTGLKAADGTSAAAPATMAIPSDAGRHWELKRFVWSEDYQPLMLPDTLS